MKKLSGHFWSIKSHFRVFSYERAVEIFESSFKSQGHELRQFYSMSIFNEDKEKHHHRHRHYIDSDSDFDDEYDDNRYNE